MDFYINEEIPEQEQVNADTTFKEYAEIWLRENKPYLAPKTYSRYVSLLDVIYQAIGHIRLNKLSTYHLQCYYDKLRQNGANRRTGGPLSQKTILHHHRLISVILHQATKDGILEFNISSKDFMKPPRVDKKEADFLQEKDIERLMDILECKPIKWKTAIEMLLFTGLRRGELLGLEWGDLDFKNNLLSIKRTSQYVNGQGIITKSPKNSTSYRVIPISSACKELLLEYKKTCSHTRYSDRIFIGEDGQPINPDTLTRYISRLIKQHDLPHFSPHSLRHTCASLLIKNGVDIATTAKLMGHSTPTTTLNIYTHAFASEQAKAIGKRLFNNCEKPSA